jgi:hypothetical protein
LQFLRRGLSQWSIVHSIDECESFARFGVLQLVLVASIRLLFDLQDLELPIRAIAEFQGDHFANLGWSSGGFPAPIAECQPESCSGSDQSSP